MTHATRPSAPRKALRLLSALILIAIVGFWAAKGAHLGWSQDRVKIPQKDEITGIEYVTYEERFVPGVDTLAIGVGAAAGLFVISLFFRPKKIKINP